MNVRLTRAAAHVLNIEQQGAVVVGLWDLHSGKRKSMICFSSIPEHRCTNRLVILLLSDSALTLAEANGCIQLTGSPH